MPRRIPSANPYTFVPQPGEADPWAAARGQLTEQQRILAENERWPDFWRHAATIGVLGGLGAASLPALLGGAAGGAGASVPGAVGASSAPLGAGTVTGGLAPLASSAFGPAAGTFGFSGTGGGMAGGIGGFLSNLFTNPDTYANLASVLGRSGQQAGESRRDDNAQASDLNRARASIYGTQQDAMLRSLLAGDQGNLNRYQTQQGATSHALDAQSNEGLQRSRLGMESGNVRARQSILGSLMQNMQPVEISGGNEQVMANMPRITGGLTPAALDPTTRQHGGALMRAALEAQLSGSDVPAATDFRGGVMTPPPVSDYSQALIDPPDMGEGIDLEGGGLENTLGGGGLIASLLAALAGQNNGRPRT